MKIRFVVLALVAVLSVSSFAQKVSKKRAATKNTTMETTPAQSQAANNCAIIINLIKDLANYSLNSYKGNEVTNGVFLSTVELDGFATSEINVSAFSTDFVAKSTIIKDSTGRKNFYKTVIEQTSNCLVGYTVEEVKKENTEETVFWSSTTDITVSISNFRGSAPDAVSLVVQRSRLLR